jgi:hypothetical protein
MSKTGSDDFENTPQTFMTSTELTHRSIRFVPELDLESVKELPGKDVMQSVLRQFSETAGCSRLIQDSHGWCFYVHAVDRRKYLVELSYASTEGGASRWVLSCARCPGWRLWEFFSANAENTGRERALLDRGAEFLVAQQGFERGDG